MKEHIDFASLPDAEAARPAHSATRAGLRYRHGRLQMDEQCCRTCKDWQPKKPPYVGICKAPIPDCVEVFHKDYVMLSNDGAKCPCYQKREASE